MNVFINGEPLSVENGISLKSFSEKYLASSAGVAIAINQNIIPKNKWGQYPLKENEHLTIIKATQGG